MLKELPHLAISTRSLPVMRKAVCREFTAMHAVIPARRGASRGQIADCADYCRRAVIEEISDRERAELFLVVAQIKTDLGVPFTGVLILTVRHVGL